MEKRFILKNEEDTAALGASIAEGLKPGAVIALTGDLGAGKTTLTKAVARALGVTETLTSPTFTIVQEYESGRMPVYHFDVYRVHGEDDLFELGFDDYLHGKGVCLIEWADLIEDLLPKDAMRIRLEYGANEDERICTIC
jgi:tRNA threonylcarbamoyladenosine biosynthesis protein TsaE